MVVNLIALGKFARFSFFLMGAGMIVFSIISALIVGLSGEGWEEFARATGGKILSTDRDIGITVEKLEDIKSNPSNYDLIDVDNTKTRLWQDIILLGVIFYFFFWLGVKLWDGLWHDTNFATYIVVAIFTILLMSMFQIGWLIYESKYIESKSISDKITFPEAMPFYGTYHFFRNIKLLSVTGDKKIYEETPSFDNNILDEVNVSAL